MEADLQLVRSVKVQRNVVQRVTQSFFFVILPFIAMLCYILQGRFDRSAVLCHLYLLFLLLFIIVVKMLHVSQKLIDAQQIKSLVQVFGDSLLLATRPALFHSMQDI